MKKLASLLIAVVLMAPSLLATTKSHSSNENLLIMQPEVKKKKAEFKVYGNCGMCESRIEKAANSLDGVFKADWDKETKMITVHYDQSETEVKNIHQAIADAGHDTKKAKADDEDYNNLPGCCKYEREE